MAYTKGIDISHYQNEAGGIDWNALANPVPPDAPIGFVYIKLTDGKTNDAYGLANATAANNGGLPFGYYHFAYPGSGNAPEDEASAFYNQVVAACNPTANFPYMLDLERNFGLSQDDYLTWVKTFLQTFQGKFRTPVPPSVLIYGSPANLNAWLPSIHDLGANYPLWVAHYNVPQPTVPNGWTDWQIWQYSLSGTVTGIIGNVDLDWSK